MKKQILLIILLACLVLPAVVAGSAITPNSTLPINITHRIVQGETVYVNDTIDISGVVPPYPYLAYWDGWDEYDDNASYVIDLPDNHEGYYNFYIDPAIFANRLGAWYKYDGNFNSNSNDIAFVVTPQILKNSTMRYENGTVVNLSVATSGANTSMLNNFLPPPPPVPPKFVADYLVARGDSWNISVNQSTNIWLFGTENELMDFSSVNNTIDVNSNILENFQPGKYTLVVQTMANGSSNFTVKYDPSDDSIKWFDPATFTIQSESMYGDSPEVTMQKFKDLIPETYDNFTICNFSLEDPSIQIVSVDETDVPNETVDLAGVTHYNTNASFVDVKGYTNVAPDEILTFYMDQNTSAQNEFGNKNPMNTATTQVGGNYGGYERWFEAQVPFDKYGTALGDHTITGYTNLSNTGTNAHFYLYAAPPDSYVPSQPIRYIAGRNGDQEFVPTPTPVIQTVTVVQTIPVTVTITIPVTPPIEVVHQQQQDVFNANVRLWAEIVIVGAIIIIGFLWLLSLYLRKKEMEE